MLEALNVGVKGGKWFRLIDKDSSLKNQKSDIRKVEVNKGAAGVDYVSIEQFAMRLETNLESLSESLIRRKIKRCNGHSHDKIAMDVKRTLRGWFEYFKHSHRYTFHVLDSRIRM